MINEIAGYKLYDFQRISTDYVKSRKYSLLALSMGLGKSIISLWAAKELQAKKILIICPASLINQWLELCKKFYPKSFISTLDNLGQVSFYDSWIIIGSYNKISSDKIKRKLHDYNYDFVIIDECHFIKNPTSQRTKSILGTGSFIPKAKQVCLMSGTPILNRPVEIYMTLKAFAPKLLGPYLPWPIFVRHFCGFQGKGCTRADELEKILSEFILCMTKEQVLKDLPPIVETVVHIPNISIDENEYLPTQRRLIGLEKTPFIIEYIKDLLKTIDKCVLILYHTETIEILHKAFPGSVTLQGGLSVNQKSEKIQKFKNESSCNLLIGQINVIGYGIDGLQHNCNYMVFGELDWSPGVIEQAKDRLRRIGQTSTVFVAYLIASGTLDEDIDLKLEWKRETIASLIKPSKIERKQNKMEQFIHQFADLVAQKVAHHLGSAQSVPLAHPDILPDEPKQTKTKNVAKASTQTSAPLTHSVITGVTPVDKEELTADIRTLFANMKKAGVAEQDIQNYYTGTILNGLKDKKIDNLDHSDSIELRARVNKWTVTFDQIVASLVKPTEPSNNFEMNL
jgi:SNF2 family DNA or RNA helicase